MKDYTIEIELKFLQSLEATNSIEAIEKTKEIFDEDFNIKLKNDEIKILEAIEV